MPRRVGEHVERLALVAGTVEQQAGAQLSARSRCRSSSSTESTPKSMCICIGTSSEGQVGGVVSRFSWMARTRLPWSSRRTSQSASSGLPSVGGASPSPVAQAEQLPVELGQPSAVPGVDGGVEQDGVVGHGVSSPSGATAIRRRGAVLGPDGGEVLDGRVVQPLDQ